MFNRSRFDRIRFDGPTRVAPGGATFRPGAPIFGRAGFGRVRFAGAVAVGPPPPGFGRARFARARFGGTSAATPPPPPPPVIVGATLFDCIAPYLGGLPALSALAGVYRNKPPRGWSLPLLVFNAIGSDPQINNSPTHWEFLDVQFTVLAADDETAQALARAASVALEAPPRGVAFAPADCAEMTRFPTANYRLGLQPGRGPGDVNVWAWAFQYRWLLDFPR